MIAYFSLLKCLMFYFEIVIMNYIEDSDLNVCEIIPFATIDDEGYEDWF